jgi:DNA processing protein
VKDLRFEIELGQPDYPTQLSESPNPPAVLYGIGNPSALEPALGVIGARRATPYGISAAEQFAGWAAAAGYVVVSGGAIGCDQAAHKAALAANGRTVAVLAGGADVPYPRGSHALLEQITVDGAVVSEHPWGTEPRRWAFRTRNRIIAALSGMLLVVEAALPSGTFSTADYAIDANRSVGVVPGSIFGHECRGSNRLLCQGAYPICDISDLRGHLEQAIGPLARQADEPNLINPPSDDKVLTALRSMPMRPDDIAFRLSMDIVEVARRVSALEVAGLVVRHRDGRYGSVAPGC